jgi:hypothetical protein
VIGINEDCKACHARILPVEQGAGQRFGVAADIKRMDTTTRNPNLTAQFMVQLFASIQGSRTCHVVTRASPFAVELIFDIS